MPAERTCHHCNLSLEENLGDRDLPPGKLYCLGCVAHPDMAVLMPDGININEAEEPVVWTVLQQNGEPHGNDNGTDREGQG